MSTKRVHVLKPAPQRRALPKSKTDSDRRQHSGGEPSRRAKKEIDEGKVSFAGRSSAGPMTKNNIGAKGKGSQVSRSRKMRQAKVSQQARR